MTARRARILSLRATPAMAWQRHGENISSENSAGAYRRNIKHVVWRPMVALVKRHQTREKTRRDMAAWRKQRRKKKRRKRKHQRGISIEHRHDSQRYAKISQAITRRGVA